MEGEKTYVSPKQLKAIEHLWEVVGSLPDKNIREHLKDLRIVADLLEIDADEFYDFTGGFFLDEPEINLD